MPLIAYKGAHGSNDFPLHMSLFSHLSQIGILDRFDFALDTWHDPDYCRLLVKLFPQLQLLEDTSKARRWLYKIKDRVGRGYRPLCYLDKFDAVCEGPGGRINEIYTTSDIFRFYPRVKRRAIVFHSIESGALKIEEVRNSVASADLVIARTSRSAENARNAGAKRVCEAADIVFLQHPQPVHDRPGIAVALRLPNDGAKPQYLDTLREIVNNLTDRKHNLPVDFVRVEPPFGYEMQISGLGSYVKPFTGLVDKNTLYVPFQFRREAIISSRLHTTLVALLHGNRKILQYHIEAGTNKTADIFEDIGLTSVPVHRIEDVHWPLIERFLAEAPSLPENEAKAALELAKSKTLTGIDAFVEWLDSIK